MVSSLFFALIFSRGDEFLCVVLLRKEYCKIQEVSFEQTCLWACPSSAQVMWSSIMRKRRDLINLQALKDIKRFTCIYWQQLWRFLGLTFLHWQRFSYSESRHLLFSYAYIAPGSKALKDSELFLDCQWKFQFSLITSVGFTSPKITCKFSFTNYFFQNNVTNSIMLSADMHFLWNPTYKAKVIVIKNCWQKAILLSLFRIHFDQNKCKTLNRILLYKTCLQ